MYTDDFLCPLVDLRLHTVVSGPAGQLGPQFSCRGSGAPGSLHCTAQSARLVTHQTGPALSAWIPEQDGLLLHYCTGTPGTATNANSQSI